MEVLWGRGDGRVEEKRKERRKGPSACLPLGGAVGKSEEWVELGFKGVLPSTVLATQCMCIDYTMHGRRTLGAG